MRGFGYCAVIFSPHNRCVRVLIAYMYDLSGTHPHPTHIHTIVPVESSQEERDSRGLGRHVEGERRIESGP